MNARFEDIWKLYRHGRPRPPLVGDTRRTPSGEDVASAPCPFDGDVKAGDVRIFADTNRPLVVLVVEDRGLLGYRIVPVSPFTEPASKREVALGGRVYQAWNAASAARSFVARSWLVDTLDASRLAAVRNLVRVASPGRVQMGDSAVAAYEREFLVSGGTFASPLELPRRSSGVFHVEWPRVGRFAASVAICIGVFYLVLGPARRKLGVWREKAYAVAAMEGVDELELATAETDKETQCESIEDLSVFADFSPEKLIGKGEVPVLDGTRPSAPVKGQSLAENMRRIDAVHFLPIHRPDESSYENPYRRPLSVLETGPFESLASAGHEGGGVRTDKTVAGISLTNVVVRTVDCPWNPEALLLNVKAGEVADGLVEVFFDKSLVRAYKVVGGGGTRPLDAWYEFIPVAGAEPGAEFCRVTVRSPAPGGDRRRVVRIRQAEPKDFESMPSPGRHATRRAALADTNDIPVEVTIE